MLSYIHNLISAYVLSTKAQWWVIWETQRKLQHGLCPQVGLTLGHNILNAYSPIIDAQVSRGSAEAGSALLQD